MILVVVERGLFEGTKIARDGATEDKLAAIAAIIGVEVARHRA
jgi:hypothetical protein